MRRICRASSRYWELIFVARALYNRCFRKPESISMATWEIGATAITRVGELLGFASLPPQDYFVGFERELLGRHLDWLVPHHYSQEHDRLITSVHSWLIRTDQQTVLLDCCAGNHKNRPGFARFHQLDTPFLQRLRE